MSIETYSEVEFKIQIAKSVFMLFTKIELTINFHEKPEDSEHDVLVLELTDCIDDMFYTTGDIFDNIKLDSEKTDIEYYDEHIKDYYNLESKNGYPRIDFCQTDLVILWSMLEEHFSVLTCIQFLLMPIELYVRYNMLHNKTSNLDFLLKDYAEYLKFLLTLIYKYRTSIEDKTTKEVSKLLLAKIKRVQNVIF
jgi:hypothetical protein